MPFDLEAYHNLERQFKDQVERDRVHIIEQVVEGWGVYFPNKKPQGQVDYIIVGMEPSFNWAGDIKHAERKIADGERNFGWSECTQSWNFTRETDVLAILLFSIERFLCAHGETFHLTDIAKGAMPVTVAALDRDRRYDDWYPLLLEEIKIVSKPGAPVIAIGRIVENFLRKKNLEEETNRKLHSVLHYSLQASASWKELANRDREGYERFCSDVLSNLSFYDALSEAKRELLFTYKVQFGKIRGE